MDAQFQLWVSITFAVIVAAFVARTRLSRRLRYVISVLYLLATLNLALLFYRDAQTALNAVGVLDESEGAMLIDRTGSMLLAPTRFGLLIIGTVSALYFLIRSYRGDSRTEK